MSVRLWRLDVKLHPLDTFNGGILTCPHVGIDGRGIKTKKGTLVPLNSGDLGILHALRFLPGLHLQQGAETNFRCNL
jgi:hypothetical protein